MTTEAQVRSRPILFKPEMVRAILDGRKTVTRRPVKPGPSQDWLTQATIASVDRFENRSGEWWGMAVGPASRIEHCGVEIDGGHIGSVRCPYGATGDRLWVRETWACRRWNGNVWRFCYGADATQIDVEMPPYWTPPAAALREGSWAPSIFLPALACRLTLEVVSVRVERLHAITEADARAEGIEIGRALDHDTHRDEFASAWNRMYGEDAALRWQANPWVWRVEFKRVAETRP